MLRGAVVVCICVLWGCGTRKDIHHTQKVSALTTQIKQSSSQEMNARMQDSTRSYEVVRVEYYPPFMDSAGHVVKDAIKTITTTKAIQNAVKLQAEESRTDTLVVTQKTATTEQTWLKEVKRTGLPWWVWLVGGLAVAAYVGWRVYVRKGGFFG